MERPAQKSRSAVPPRSRHRAGRRAGEQSSHCAQQWRQTLPLSRELRGRDRHRRCWSRSGRTSGAAPRGTSSADAVSRHGRRRLATCWLVYRPAVRVPKSARCARSWTLAPAAPGAAGAGQRAECHNAASYLTARRPSLPAVSGWRHEGGAASSRPIRRRAAGRADEGRPQAVALVRARWRSSAAARRRRAPGPMCWRLSTDQRCSEGLGFNPADWTADALVYDAGARLLQRAHARKLERSEPRAARDAAAPSADHRGRTELRRLRLLPVHGRGRL